MTERPGERQAAAVEQIINRGAGLTAEQIVDARFPKAGEGLRASLLALVQDSIQAGREQASAADEEAIVEAVAGGGRWSMPTDVALAGWWPKDEDRERARQLIESLRYAGYEIIRVSGDAAGRPVVFAI